METVEGSKEVGKALLGNSAPRITDLDTDGDLIFPLNLPADGECDPALVCIFDRIAQQVQKDLTHHLLVTNQLLRNLRFEPAGIVQPLALRIHPDQIVDLFDDLRQ